MALIGISLTGFAGQDIARMLPKVKESLLEELESRLGEIIFEGEREHEKSASMRYFDFSAEFDVPEVDHAGS